MTKVLFSAFDPTHGHELWVTDGSSGGTYLLKDIDLGMGNSYPSDITPLGNGKALFEAYNPTYGAELWVTDGTTNGTLMVKDINPGKSSSNPSGITVLSAGKAVFTATDGNGTELWVTDGTAPGTQIIANASVNAFEVTALGNGNAVFAGTDSTNGHELWITNGTAGGTHVVKDINPGPYNSYPYGFTAIGNGKALFGAKDNTYGDQLWVTDGTAAGTLRLTNVTQPTNQPPDFGDITPLGNGNVLFVAYNQSFGEQLWVTDGAANTKVLTTTAHPTYSRSPGPIAALGNGSAVFSANDGSHGVELWVTNGTSGGTMLLDDINAGAASSSPRYLTALGNGKVVFDANDGIHGSELWVTDGTAAGTMMVKDINPGAGNSIPHNIKAIGGGLAMFSADDGIHGNELWETDGTSAGTIVVSNGPSDPGNFGVLQPACFCRGTLILTERGEVAVEDLAVGDRVKTRSGALRPIVWIGLGRDLVTRANKLARPVVVRRDALADNVPARDLYLTHGHALHFDSAIGGVLIPVENLVNHRSILWDDSARVVEYYHIELAEHDVLLANGAPAETYYDCGNRALFHNTRAGSRSGAALPTFAPVLNGGDIVEQVWARLFARAGGQIECDTTDDPNLHLVVDSERLNPARIEDCAYSFALNRPPEGTLRLRSRSAVPSLLGISAHDHRRLGVAVSRIVLHQPGIGTSFDYRAPLFASGGCHPAENGYCWTDGELELPARLFTQLDNGPFTLTVHIEKPGMRYPSAAATAAAA